MIKKELMIEFGTQTAIADFFGITVQAVSQWADDSSIPRERCLELQLRRPDLFKKEDRLGPSPARHARPAPKGDRPTEKIARAG